MGPPLKFKPEHLAHLKRGIAVFLLTVLVSCLFAGMAGFAAQKTYRGWIGYHSPTAVEETTDNELSYTEKIKQYLAEIKDESKEKLSEALRQTKIIQSFLILFDKAAFWIPFAVTFMVAFFVVRKLLRLKKSLWGETDPVIQHNFEAVISRVNELESKVAVLEEPGGPTPQA